MSADPRTPARNLAAAELATIRWANALAPAGSGGTWQVRPDGVTVQGWLDASGLTFRLPTVCLYHPVDLAADAEPLPIMRAAWSTTVLRPGDEVQFVSYPRGGKGGKIIGALLMIAMVVTGQLYLLPALTPILGATGAALAVAGITMIGGMLINAVFGQTPETPKLQSPEAASPTYSIGAQANSARLMQPIPRLYGSHIIYPDLGSQPYTEYRDNDQFLYQLLVLSAGDVDVDAIRVGGTTLWDAASGFTTSFEDVEFEVRKPDGTVTRYTAAHPTGELVGTDGKVLLFPDNVVSSVEVASQELTCATAPGPWFGPFAAGPAGSAITHIQIDLAFPEGLGHFNGNGSISELSVDIEIQAQPIDAAGAPLGDWFLLVSTTVTAGTMTPQRRTLRAAVTPARYQVRARRTNVEATANSDRDSVRWEALRGYVKSTHDYGNVTLLAVAIRANEQLSNSSARQFNAICTAKLPSWNKETQSWAAPARTRSLAWAAVDMQRADYGARLPDSRIDLDTFADLDVLWAARGDRFDGVFDTSEVFWSALSKALKAGRARPLIIGGMVSARRDQPQTVVKGVFTPRNTARGSFGLEAGLWSEDSPDGVTLTFMNRTTWKPQEVTVPPDAEQPAPVEGFGISEWDHAWREAAYLNAANQYRRTIVNLDTMLEGRLMLAGDLAVVSSDIPAWGQTGDLEAVAGDQLTLSEPVTFADASPHYMSFRMANGAEWGPIRVHPVGFAGAGDAEVVQLDAATLASVIASMDGVDIREAAYTGNARERTAFAFGKGSEWRKQCLVIGVRPGTDMGGGERTSMIFAVEDPRVHEADTGTPPAPPAPPLLPGELDGPVVTRIYVTNVTLYGDVEATAEVSWSPAAGAETYVLETSTDGINWTAKIKDTKDTKATITVPRGAAYVRVAAIGKIRGPWAVWSGSLLANAFVPSAVTSLAHVGAYVGGSISVTWVTSVDAASHRVRLLVDSVEVYRVTLGAVTAFIMTKAQATNIAGPWRSVTVEVTAINTRGEAAPTTLALNDPAPSAPTGLTAGSGTSTTRALSWSVSDSDIDARRVWVSTTNGFNPDTLTPTYTPAGNSQTATGLTPSTTYYWRVAVRDQFGGWSPASAQASFTTSA